MPELRNIFGGTSMKYWYVAFIISMAGLVAVLINSASVTQFELTIYDNEGRVVETRIVDKDDVELRSPENLPVTKSYKPLKPVSFL